MTAAAEPLAVRLQYSPHTPEPPQHAFLWINRLEALYGGAAGGGKSDALLMGALQYVDVPGYAALLLRKTYADLALPGALMDRAHAYAITAEWETSAVIAERSSVNRNAAGTMLAALQRRSPDIERRPVNGRWEYRMRAS